MKALFIPLKREFYEDFVAGRKGEEYRPYGPRWNENTCPVGRPVIIVLGYGVEHRRTGVITGFRTDKAMTKTEAWQKCYAGKGYKVAACIAIKLDPQ